ncbi:MAG: inositol-3-phosphate synthase [Deltaproteobacteria bacterium]|nr:inositol-3-phosphate synthase [Deltaproteobacteria bacterium]MBW2307106.1 inositol-3-phosphate synthase [Deltaproteobacteria bacterium]
MGKINVAIAGIGNCASSLLQGIEYYRNNPGDSLGLMHENMCGYVPGDIQVVAAFDIDARKVGKPVEEAIFAPPNCTIPIWKDMLATGVTVKMGPVMDGVAIHMHDYDTARTFVAAQEMPCNVVEELRASKAHILINYLPVGSEDATRFYAQCALDAGVSFLNCMPVFIASNEEWARKFEAAGTVIVGDDVKSQIGATVIHRILTRLFEERGVFLERTYQLNTGGNTDFLNMLERSRLKSKKISKTNAVQSQLSKPLHPDNIHIGPSDYVPWQNDNKVCFIRMEGRGFAGIPMNLELRLSVEDSPNSGGVAIDAIRYMKVAMDRGCRGVLYPISSYCMKHPPIQTPEERSREMIEEFLSESSAELATAVHTAV